MHVEKHHMIMDNPEVTVVKWENSRLQRPRAEEAPADGFFQK